MHIFEALKALTWVENKIRSVYMAMVSKNQDSQSQASN